MKRCLRLAVALPFLVPHALVAWGRGRAQVAAYIAQARLSPAAKKGVHERLHVLALALGAGIALWAWGFVTLGLVAIITPVSHSTRGIVLNRKQAASMLLTQKTDLDAVAIDRVDESE